MGQITSRRLRSRGDDSTPAGKAFSDDNIVHKERTFPTCRPWTSFIHPKSTKSHSTGQGHSSTTIAGETHRLTHPEHSLTLPTPASENGSLGASHQSDLGLPARTLDPERDPDQRLTSSDVILRKRTNGTGSDRPPDGVFFQEESKVSEVLSQTVTFLSYEVDPLLIAEFLQRRSKRNRKQDGETRNNKSPSITDEDVSRVLWRIISDLNSEEYRSFCDLMRKIDYDRHVLDFLEALDDLLRLVTSAGSGQSLPPLLGISSAEVPPYGCTCPLSSDDERILWSRTTSAENSSSTADRHFEIRFVYADRESRSAQSFPEVERMKRRRRRKSRLVVSDGHVTVLGDTSDRYIPMMSVRLFNSCLCEGQMRRLGRILESRDCIRDLAIVETRFDTPAKVRLGHSLAQNLCLFQLDLSRCSIGNDGAMYLANALTRNGSIRVLKLSENSISSRGCCLLVRAIFRRRNITELDLGINEIGDAGCQEIARAVANNCALQHLQLPSNCISTSGAISLFRALRTNSRLQRLDLSDNAIGDDSLDVLSEMLILNRTLSEIALEKCGLTEVACPPFARMFKANMKLKIVKLSDNPLGDEGLTLLAEGIKYNRTLEDLSFDGCGIGDVGLLSLLDASRYNATLKAVHLCRNNIALASGSSLPQSTPETCWESGDLDVGEVVEGGSPLPAQEIYTRLRQANTSLTIVLKESGITKTVI